METIEAIAKHIGSVPFVFTYLAFGFAASGLANSSRHRWEDLALRPRGGEQSALLDRARDQAWCDFVNWYRWMIAISLVVTGLSFGSLCFAQSTPRGLLWISLAVVTLGTAFFICAFWKERQESAILYGKPPSGNEPHPTDAGTGK